MAIQLLSQQMLELQKALFSVYPGYSEEISVMKRCMDAYEDENIDSYLHRHKRENEDIYKDRKKRSVYENYCQPIVDLYASFLFRMKISRDAQETDAKLKKEVDAFWEDCDGQGTNINQFMMDAETFALILGSQFIVVDMPRITEVPTNESERRALNLRPYLAQVHGFLMTNYAVDEEGELLWVRFVEQPEDESDPFKLRPESVGWKELQELGTSKSVAEKVSKKIRFKTWTRNEWFIHEVDKEGIVTDVDSDEHGLGVVPVIALYSSKRKSDPFRGVSLIKSISKNNITLYNWASILDEDMYTKCINVLVIKRSLQGETTINLSSNNALEYDGDEAPHYLVPSSEPGAFIVQMMDRKVNEIYRTALLGGDSGVQQMKSGVAFAFEFNETNNALARKADFLEHAEHHIMDVFCKWFEGEWKGKIDYPEEFAIKAFSEELKNMTDSKMNVRSPIFKQEIEKGIAGKMLPKIDKDMRAKIDKEIDTLPEPPPPTFGFGGGF